jgi:hypothetical protein
MIGDSITEQHLYSNYVEAWTVTRFPAWKISFRNVGIGGDRSPGGNSRFKRDVLIHKPTALTVDFGMNDGSYRGFDENGFKTYMKGLEGMAEQARAANVRVAWITPQPIEKNEDGPPQSGYNETLERYSEGVKEVAGKYNGLFIDQFHPFLDVLQNARSANPKSRIGGGDAIHPGGPGQALMAYAILKGMHFPTLVSSAEIDAGSGKVVKADHCEVTDVATSGGSVRFRRHDQALPFFPDEAKSIEKWLPIREELNDYRLQVTGLKEGKYAVKLGGKKVAEFSAAELAKGVNLAEGALKEGPVADQVKAIWQAVKAKNDYHHQQIFRGVVLSQVPDWLEIKDVEERRQAAVAKRLARMPELDAAIQKALMPTPHDVEIAPE